MSRYVFDFSDGSKELRDLLGGKGANLAEMTRMGLPVPPGFTVTTDACREYLLTGGVPAGLLEEVEDHLRLVEAEGAVAERQRRAWRGDPFVQRPRAVAKGGDVGDRDGAAVARFAHFIGREPDQPARQPRDAAVGEADGRVDEMDRAEVEGHFIVIASGEVAKQSRA